jgi:hypothetical protein
MRPRQRGDAVLPMNDIEGQAVFKRIVRAVEELWRHEPLHGEQLN